MTIQEALQQILGEVDEVLRQVDPRAVERLLDAVASARRVYVAGEGRSGLVARTFAMRLVHLGKTAYVCSETITPAIQAGDLCVACSGSGETPITCHRAEQSKRVGAAVAAIVGAPGTPLGSHADIEIVLPAPTKSSLPRPLPQGEGRVRADEAGAAPNPASLTPPLSRGERERSRQFGATLFEQALLLFLDAVVLQLQERSGASPESMFAKHTNLE